MKFRIIAAAALAAGLALTVSGAQAATPVLDGKKVKVLQLSGAGGQQVHDQDTASLSLPDKFDCAPERCKRLPFVYKPAAGIKGDLMITATWTNPLSDIDMYLFEVQKNKTGVEINNCGALAGNSEKFFVPKAQLRAGRTYVLLMDFYRSINETATAKVEINVPNTAKQVIPPEYDGELPGTVFKFNCAL